MTKLHTFVNLHFIMVNINDSRAILLSLLEGADGSISGEVLSRHLGISRVAVWKQIGRLEEMGYSIESSRKGYRLTGKPDDPMGAHLFSGRERFYCLEETGSTMDYADDILSRQGGGEDFVVTADVQNAGRGRREREWVSPRGGLFFTHSFSSVLPSPRSYRATMAALVTLTEVLRDDYGQNAFIKWPNDILVEGKKIIGVLAAFSGEEERITRFNLGVGINVNNAPPLPGQTCSLSSLTGRNLSRSDLIKRYLNGMERHRKEGDDSLPKLYNDMLIRRGRVLFSLGHGERLAGIPREVSDSGALLLDTGRTVLPGECEKTERTS